MRAFWIQLHVKERWKEWWKESKLSMKALPLKFKSHFNFDLHEEDFEDFKRGYVPPNTALDMQKCMKLFSDWASKKCTLLRESSIRQHSQLHRQDPHVWMAMQVCKWSMKERWKPYPPKTIHHYIMGIQCYIRQTTKSSVKHWTVLWQEKARATKLLLCSCLSLLSLYQASAAVHLTIVPFSSLRYQLYPKQQMEQFLTTMILLASTWQSFLTSSWLCYYF